MRQSRDQFLAFLKKEKAKKKSVLDIEDDEKDIRFDKFHFTDDDIVIEKRGYKKRV